MSSQQLCHSHNHHNHIVYISSKQISIRCQCRTDSFLLYCLPLNHKDILCYIRGCQRKWLAGYRSLCKSQGILSGWGSSWCCFGLVVHLKGKGLWIGMVTGSTVQAFLLALKTSFTNWEKQVIRTKKKLFLSIYIFFIITPFYN